MAEKREYTPVPRHPGIFSYKTQRGTRYRVRRGFQNIYGKADEYSKSGFKSWRDAEADLHKFENDLSNGSQEVLTNRSVTVHDAWEILLKRQQELELWRPITVKQRLGYYNRGIKEQWGNRKLQSIKRLEYQNYIDDLAKQGYYYNTVSTMNSVMQQIFNNAVKLDLLDKNRIAGISVTGHKPKPVAISDEDYDKVVKTAKAIFTPYELTVFYLFTLGARREEVLGLQLRSFELGRDERGRYYKITYYVGRTAVEVNGSDLKSDAAYRSNFARGRMVGLIDYSLQHAKDICARTNHEVTPETFLYLNESNGNPPSPGKTTDGLFHRLKDASGVEIRPHMLRHRFATIGLESEEANITVAHWLGHKNISMTESYATPTNSGALHLIDGLDSKLHPDTNEAG